MSTASREAYALCPEPEVVASDVMDECMYAFVGLECISGAMVYDITKPDVPEFVQYLSNRDFAANPSGRRFSSGNTLHLDECR